MRPNAPHAREWHIPSGAIKIADKHSDAVAYIFTDGRGRPNAKLFLGKQGKPAWFYSFKTDANREKTIREAFQARRASIEAAAKRKADVIAAGPGLEVGDILYTSWGYDQTNTEFFEVVAMSGKMATLREVRCASSDTGGPAERVVPQSGDYIGEPIRRLAREGRVAINSYRSAWKWNTSKIAGVPVGPAKSVTGAGWGH